MARVNGETKRRIVAIIEGEKATVGEKLDLLLGMVMDLHEETCSHDARIVILEKYPQAGAVIVKVVLGLGALAGAGAAIYGLVKLMT